MKKMFFGSLLFVVGIIGVFVFILLSVNHPWNYDGIVGLRGFLMGSRTSGIFILLLISAVIGLAICFYEAYIRKTEK